MASRRVALRDPLRSAIELLVPSVCPACDRPRRAGEPLLCGVCAQSLEPQDWSGDCATALTYRGSALELIQRLKFEARRDGLPILTGLLAARTHGLHEPKSRGLNESILVPVPRHRSRIREHRSDPVHLLAKRLARALGCPLVSRALERTRPTRPQTELTRRERLLGPSGSFAARPGEVGERAVLLLDDVVTTGATLRAASQALRAAGARRVTSLALAAAPEPGSARNTL